MSSDNLSENQLAGTKRLRGGLPLAQGSLEKSEASTPRQADAKADLLTDSQSQKGDEKDDEAPDVTPSKSLGQRFSMLRSPSGTTSPEGHSAEKREPKQTTLQRLVAEVEEFTKLRRNAKERLAIAMAAEGLSTTGADNRAQDSAAASDSQTLETQAPLTELDDSSSETETPKARFLTRPRSLSDLGTTNLKDVRSRIIAMQNDEQFFPGSTDVDVHSEQQPYTKQDKTSKVRIDISTPRPSRPRAKSISGDEYETPERRTERRGRATQAAFTPKVGARVAAPPPGDEPPSSDDDSSDYESRIPYHPQPVPRRRRGGDEPPEGGDDPPSDDGAPEVGSKRPDKRGGNGGYSEPSAPRPKIDAPSKYDGTDDRPATLRVWTRDMDAYLKTIRINPETYGAMPYIQMCLSGMAKEMYADWRQSMSWPGPDSDTMLSPLPFSKVIRRFEKEYVSPTAHREAETKWNKIYQERPDGTLKRVTEVIREINQVSKDRAATSEHEMTRKLYDSLHPGLIQSIQLMEGDPDRVSWTKLQKLAKEAEIMFNVQEASKLAAKLPIGQRISNYEAAMSGSMMNKMLRKATKSAETKAEGRESNGSQKKNWKKDKQQAKPNSDPKQSSEQAKPESSSNKTAKKKWSKSDAEKRADQFARGACFKCNIFFCRKRSSYCPQFLFPLFRPTEKLDGRLR